MRTLLFMISGLLLVAAFLLLGKLFSSHYPDATRWATVAYVVVWFMVAGANMWVGVAKAGYSVGLRLSWSNGSCCEVARREFAALRTQNLVR